MSKKLKKLLIIVQALLPHHICLAIFMKVEQMARYFRASRRYSVQAIKRVQQGYNPRI
jgi:hypothetical protein